MSRSAARIRDPEPFFLVAELDWDDMALLQRDFASPLGKEASRDVDDLARLCPGIQNMVFELEAL